MRSVTPRRTISLVLAIVAGFLLHMGLMVILGGLLTPSCQMRLPTSRILEGHSPSMSLNALKLRMLGLPAVSKRFLRSVLDKDSGQLDDQASGETSDHASDNTSGHVSDQLNVQPTGSTSRQLNDTFLDENLHKDDTSLADELFHNIRVLCWVLTSPENLDTRCVYIQQTWGRRCNKLLFFSSVDNATFPTIGIGTGEEGRNHLMSKQSRAFQYVYEHYYDDYDWFLKTDDDAYVIMENLRYFLSSRDTNQPVYFGHHFKTIAEGGYFAGGPGIVLGKLALKRFVEVYENRKLCRQDGRAADAALSQCLYKVGVYAGNSTDALGRSRFHCFRASIHAVGRYPAWYYDYDVTNARYGLSTMSDYAIGFHYLSGEKMLEMEYLLYHLRPYGVRYGMQELNQPWTKGNITIRPLF